MSRLSANDKGENEAKLGISKLRFSRDLFSCKVNDGRSTPLNREVLTWISFWPCSLLDMTLVCNARNPGSSSGPDKIFSLNTNVVCLNVKLSVHSVIP